MAIGDLSSRDDAMGVDMRGKWKKEEMALEGNTFFTAVATGHQSRREVIRTLAWNCRGLGNSFAVCALQELLKKEDPNLFFSK